MFVKMGCEFVLENNRNGGPRFDHNELIIGWNNRVSKEKLLFLNQFG